MLNPRIKYLALIFPFLLTSCPWTSEELDEYRQAEAARNKESVANQQKSAPANNPLDGPSDSGGAGSSGHRSPGSTSTSSGSGSVGPMGGAD
ncbi:MAG: hypothetical protein KF712_06365 [Akkermansiaceae bacterium]|nr:hypothetical protein [Akkermansiaceae bacterium]